jgi:phage tail sheath protein FI
MPTILTYPGVYIEEIPSGVHTIEGVATSIAAFVGRASMGPIDVPVPIQSFAEYTRIFGGLWSKSSLGFAVLDFFMNGGQQAVVVRVYNGTKKLAGSGAAGRTLTKTQILKGLAVLDQCDLFNLLCIPPYRTDAQNGDLNPLGINCLRSFPSFGSVVWGSRTLQGADGLASEWKYIPVRRTALFIEESLYRGTQWVVFEPNEFNTTDKPSIPAMDASVPAGAFQTPRLLSVRAKTPAIAPHEAKVSTCPFFKGFD